MAELAGGKHPHKGAVIGFAKAHSNLNSRNRSGRDVDSKSSFHLMLSTMLYVFNAAAVTAVEYIYMQE